MTVPLSTLPTNARFKTANGERRKLSATSWDKLRDNPDHWLNGINPQVERRADVEYVVDGEGVLSLMPPDTLVEPVPEPPPVSEYAYRVTVADMDSRWSYGANTISDVHDLIRMIGLTKSETAVAIEYGTVHINADGSLCREQGKGLQFRSVG